jgi:hypothetical protein
MVLTAVWSYFHKGNTSVGRTVLQILAQCLLLIRRGGYRGLRAHIKRQVRSQAQATADYALWLTTQTRAATKRD